MKLLYYILCLYSALFSLLLIRKPFISNNLLFQHIDVDLIDYNGETRLQMGYYPDRKRSIVYEISYHRDVKEMISYFYQVMIAVALLHSKNIIHGDLKPENTCWNGQYLKLIDFGESVYYGRDHGSPIKANNSGSKKRIKAEEDKDEEDESQEEIGEDEDSIIPKHKRRITPGHAAPEILNGSRCTLESDVYSLGVLLGRILMTSLNVSDYYHFIEEKDIKMINRLSSSIGLSSFGKLIVRLISEEPSNRPTSREAFLEFNEMIKASFKYSKMQKSLHDKFYSIFESTCSTLNN